MNLKQFPKRLDSKTSCLRISVPENLDLALEGLIRKVLREQPKTDDIYSFAADYFETLLKIRDKAGANFTAAQLCPFHNDEDAHEMIKIAGTFSRPEKFKKGNEETSRTGRKKDAFRRPKPKQVVKEKKTVKQSPPDLIKKLPLAEETKAGERKSETIEENIEIDGEFLTSDPVKELVEKELMMEAKARGKETAHDVRRLKTSKLEPEMGNKQEKHKMDEKLDVQPEIKEESEQKPYKNEEKEKKSQEETETDVNSAETNAEESNREETKKEISKSSETKEVAEKAEVSKAPPEDANKDKAESLQEKSQNVQSLESENKLETEKVSRRESQSPTREHPAKNEQSETSPESSKNAAKGELPSEEASDAENKTETVEIRNVEPSEAPKQEEENQKAAGEQQPKAQIDKETKATGENTALLESSPLEALPLGDGSFAISPIDDAETIKNGKTVDEQRSAKNLQEIEITKEGQQNNLRNVGQSEEPTGGVEEVKGTFVESESEHKSEEKPLMNTESRDDKESLSQYDKIGSETPNDKYAEMESKTNEERKEAEADVAKSTEADEENQKPEGSKQDEGNLERAQSPEPKSSKTAHSNKVQENKEKTTPPDKDGKNHTAAELVMETRSAPADEQKPIEDENTQSKENQTGKELFDLVESQNVQGKDGSEIKKRDVETEKSSEPEELCVVVDVQNIPENETREEIAQRAEERKNQIELHAVDLINESKEHPTGLNEMEKTETTAEKGQNTEDKRLCAVADIKNVPEKPENEEKEDIIQDEEGKESQEELCSVIDVQNLPKEDLTEDNKTKQAENETPKEEKTNLGELPEVSDVENKPKEDGIDETNAGELHAVTDVENVLKKDATNENESPKGEMIRNTDDVAKPEEVSVEADAKNMPENDEEKEETTLNKNNLTNSELSTAADVSDVSKEETTRENRTEKSGNGRKGETNQNEDAAKDLTAVEEAGNIPKEDVSGEIKTTTKPETVEPEPPHIIEPEKVQNPEAVQPPEEFQIKTIQTHYYDTLRVPETVTKEYVVHNMVTPLLNIPLGVADTLQRNDKPALDENMNAHPSVGFAESATASSPSDNLRPEIQVQANTVEVETQREAETTAQVSDSDDLLDVTTPTSGYSLNLSEISWQTVSGVFLDSERRYSSLEKEEVRYATPKRDDQKDGRQEVEEVIRKTVIPTGVDAVPVPPRDAEEIRAEEATGVKEGKKEEKPEGESEGSTESRSGDSDVPFISVEVKTVIETQMLDEEEEVDGERRRPGVEVTVEATIDIQDDVEMPRSEPDATEEENKISNGKSQEISDLKSSLEGLQSSSQDERRKESSSAEQTGKGSSGESDSTLSSAATEIKRTDSAKRNFNSTRSLMSTQSLDLGKRNPLVKTRSLSTFRHGVTDFEVWNTIERELEEAATKIQSKFRGYKTRKKLQRENAVQITTEESSPSTTPAEAEAKEEGHQSTGEFHDSIVLAEHPR